jgi:hypothetical protein
LAEQRKSDVLLKKACHISEKKSEKSGKSSGFLKNLFSLSWKVALQMCIYKNP